MLSTMLARIPAEQTTKVKPVKKRIESIDLLRGIVMIIMALDHVRDYFHFDAFVYSPTDLAHTSIPLFFTRWLTHYCAPVFVFLAGISAYLYGEKKSRKELSFFLLKRGAWLVLAELFIVSLFRTFNPAFTYVNLQVIWAIGICMMVLSSLIYLPRAVQLWTGILLVAVHNMLDNIHIITGNTFIAFLWSVIHVERHFSFSYFIVYVRYPVLPWMGVMLLGYSAGVLYSASYSAERRKRVLLLLGSTAIILFILLRWSNFYGDAAVWTVQPDPAFTILSFLNVTKYPPSLLYCLMTLGPALIFLALAERQLNALAERIVVFGRLPMFYYLAHILLIHVSAIIAGLLTRFPAIIVLKNSVNATEALKGYGFNLITVYLVWIVIVTILYPLCKWFDRYKRKFQLSQWWLSYL